MSSQPSLKPKSKSLLGCYLRFLRSPDLNTPHSTISLSKKLTQVLRLYSLEVTTLFLFLSFTIAIDIPRGQRVEYHADVSAITSFMLTVFFAPLIEETVFRLPLRPFELNIALVCSVLLFIATLFAQYSGFIYVFIILVCINLLIGNNCQKIKILQVFYNEHSHLVFYSSALLFGLAHITNYESRSWFLLLWVVPQTIGGLFLGFVRMRYGFWYAVFLHAFHNAWLCLLLILIETSGLEELQSLSYESLRKLSFSECLAAVGIVVCLTGVIVVSFVVALQLIREWWKRDKLSVS